MQAVPNPQAVTRRAGLAQLLDEIHAGQRARGYVPRTLEEMQVDETQLRAEDEEYDDRWRKIWGETRDRAAASGGSILMLVYLDSVIVIYAVEGPASFQARATARIAALSAAGDQVAISDLTSLECRIKPIRVRRHRPAGRL